MIITLCGSTRFSGTFNQVYSKLSLHGYIVLTVGCLPICLRKHTPAEKESLDALHLKKIEMSDAIVVINPGMYIGDSTRREIEYATSLGKQVWYLESPDLSERIIFSM